MSRPRESDTSDEALQALFADVPVHPGPPGQDDMDLGGLEDEELVVPTAKRRRAWTAETLLKALLRRLKETHPERWAARLQPPKPSESVQRTIEVVQEVAEAVQETSLQQLPPPPPNGRRPFVRGPRMLAPKWEPSPDFHLPKGAVYVDDVTRAIEEKMRELDRRSAENLARHVADEVPTPAEERAVDEPKQSLAPPLPKKRGRSTGSARPKLSAVDAAILASRAVREIPPAPAETVDVPKPIPPAAPSEELLVAVEVVDVATPMAETASSQPPERKQAELSIEADEALMSLIFIRKRYPLPQYISGPVRAVQIGSESGMTREQAIDAIMELVHQGSVIIDEWRTVQVKGVTQRVPNWNTLRLAASDHT